MTTTGDQPTSIFRNIDADDEAPEVTEIESLCVNCEEQGTTRLFLTKIPFFREVIIGSFSCDHCGHTNSELQPASRTQDKGVLCRLRVVNEKDLNRQVVQTNSATVSVPELEFEIPPTQGAMTTVEGVIDRAIAGLDQDQILRRIQHPEAAAQIDEFICKLKELKTCKMPFHMVIDDPSGNSYIENPHAPNIDPEISMTRYKRTNAQSEALGLMVDETADEDFNAKDEVLSFATNCPSCNSPCSTNMKVVEIPHFKEVVIMATVCDACGVRENEVKAGSGIEPQGQKITLHIHNIEDLSRDVLKSEMCEVQIPELDFSNSMSTMPGKFTTVEGLLADITIQLKKFNPFFFGDSSMEGTNKKIEEFCNKIDKIKSGETVGVHLILDDPTGNSYLQNLCAPDPDPGLVIENYDRTFEQNEELGINDMKTENYEES